MTTGNFGFVAKDRSKGDTPEEQRITGGGVRRITGGGVRQPRIAGGGVRQPPRTPLPVERPLQAVQGEQRQMVVDKAATRIGFHLGYRYPDSNWQAVTPVLAEKFIETVGSNPQALAALDNDVNALWALTDQDIADRIESGEPFSDLDSILESVTEVLWEVGAKEESVQWLAQRQEGIKGQFEELTEAERAVVIREALGVEGQSVFGAKVDAGKMVGSVTRIFDEPGAWVFDPDANLLAVTVGEATVGFTPTKGFNPDSTLDVITEFVRATYNRPDELVGSLDNPGNILSKSLNAASSWGQWVDAHPTAARTIDNIWRGIQTTTPALNAGDYVDWMTGHGPHPILREGPIARHQQAIDEEKGQVNLEAFRQSTALHFPEEMIVAGVGIEIMRLFEEHGETPPDDPLALAAELVEEDREGILQNWQSLNQKELVDQLKAQLEGESAVGRVVQGGVEGTLQVFNAWETTTQWLGIQALARSGAGPALRALTDDEEDTPFDIWQKSWDGRLENLGTDPNVADYFGLEGTAADAALLAVGIGFDPLNLIFPGAKGQSKLLRQALIDPAKYGHNYLKSPAIRPIIDGIVAGGDDSFRKIMSFNWGVDGLPYVQRLRAISLDPTKTADDARAVFLDAMQNSTFLGTSRSQSLGTSEIIEKMADTVSVGKLKPSQRELIFDVTQKAGRSRLFPLGENAGMDELIDFAYTTFGSDRTTAEGWIMKAWERVYPGSTSDLVKLTDPELDIARGGLRQFADQPQIIRRNMERLVSGERIPVAAEREQAEMVAKWFHSRNKPTSGLFRGQPIPETPTVGGVLDIPIGNASRDFSEARRFATDRNQVFGEDQWIIQFADNTPAAVNPNNTNVPLVSGRFRVTGIDDANRTIQVEHIEDILPGKPKFDVPIPPADPQAQMGIAAAQKEEAQRLMNAVEARERDFLKGRDPAQMRANRDLLESSISRVDDAAVRADMEDLLARTNAEIARADDFKTQLRQDRARANEKFAAAARLQGEIYAEANKARLGLAQTIAEMYEDYAKTLNDDIGEELIPIIDGEVNAWAPDLPVRDWEAVSGVAASGRYGMRVGDKNEVLKSISIEEGFALDDVGNASKALEKSQQAINMFPKIQYMPLEVSPYELLLFRRIAKSPDAVQAWQNFTRKTKLRTFSQNIRTLFGVNLLLNGITPIKTSLDETIRFGAITGALARTLKASAAGIPGVQELNRKIGELPGFRRFMTNNGEFVTSPWSIEHARSFDQGGLNYTWIDLKTDGVNRQDFLQASERWLNGTLSQSPAFQAYARSTDFAQSAKEAVGVPDEFVRWWDTEGQFLARSHEITLNRTKEVVDANFAYRTIHNSFNNWVESNVKSTARNDMRRKMLEAAKGNTKFDIIGDADILARIKRVPAPKPSTPSGWFDKVVGKSFDFAFGNPSARRAGVFHEKFLDDGADVLARRFGGVYENGQIRGLQGGRILTPEILAERLGVDLDVAQGLVAQGTSNKLVRDVLRKDGLRTGDQLMAAASAWASRQADDLMYRYTASTLAGQGVESALLFPFARAQMDFLSWWGKHLTTPQQIAPNIPFTSIVGPSLNIGTAPLNVRALAKYGHMTAVTQNEHEGSLVDNALDRLTFFPFRYDDDFLMDVLPQPGPIPGWMFDQMVENDFLTEDMERDILALYPTLAFDQSTGDPVRDLFNAVFPSGGKSLRGLSVSTARMFAALFGSSNLDESESWLGRAYQFLSDNAIPRGTSDAIVASYADWLNENAFTGPTPGSDEWMTAADVIALEAALSINTQDGREAWLSRSPAAMFSDSNTQEARNLEAYGGLFDDFIWNELLAWDVLATNELIEENGQPRIRSVYEKFQQGEASRDDIEFLGDSLHRIYNASRDVEIFPGFTLMDAIHLNSPGIAPNRISKQEWAGGAITTPEARAFFTEHVDPESKRLQNIPPGQEGLDLINKARDRGWITTRPPDGPDGWMRDAHEVLYQSAKNAIDAAWYLGTVGFKVVDGKRVQEGRDWTGQSTKAFDKATVTTGSELQLLLSPLGLDIEPGTRMTGAEYFTLLSELRDQYRIDFNGGQLMDGPVGDSLARGSDFSKGLRSAIEEAGKTQARNDITSVRDWPEELKDAVREDLRTAISLGDLSLNDYKSDWQDLFGALDYSPPVPPPIEDLGQLEGTAGLVFTPSQYKAGEAAVIDGDTLSILLEDGPTRIRLFGINAPEVGQPGYVEATNNLLDVLNAAQSDISIGFFNVGTFGLTQRTSPEDQRLIGWLYIDGVPIYSPDVFTADNPRGVGVGGDVIDLMAILEAGR